MSILVLEWNLKWAGKWGLLLNRWNIFPTFGAINKGLEDKKDQRIKLEIWLRRSW